MTILRTIIRFLIIGIFIGMLVFLSISLFKLIPAGINQLASATVSLGNKTSTKNTNKADINQKTATLASTTEDGLNGVYDTSGDIVILDSKTAVNKTSAQNTQSYKAPASSPKTVYKTIYKTQYIPVSTNTDSEEYTYTSGTTYDPNEPESERVIPGGKNLKVTFSSIGVIDANGLFIATRVFNTQDTVSLRFTVLNEEDSPTGRWAMRVEMPASEGTDKVKILSNLDGIPGESSYTAEARFDGIDLSRGTPVIRVFLDTENQVAERNESDNTLAVTLNNVTDNRTYTNTTYYNNNGNNNSNLYISSLETGRIINGSFNVQSSINYGERLAIRARIRNNGYNSTNSYTTRLNINDVYNNNRESRNSTENSLSQNGESTVTYEFDNLTRGTNKIIFTVDTQNNVSETNEGDNELQATVQVN